jgi:biopolymer transport protein ExbB/TolQ
MNRQHYTPAPVARPLAGALLAVSIGLVLAAILLEYL